MFLGLTLLIGSIWGRTTWGVWWTWDARLTTTAVLFVLYLGYLAVRRVPADPEVPAKRAAIVAIAAFLDVPIVHFSVEWWRTLHQPASLLDERRLLDPQIDGRHGLDAAARRRRLHPALRLAAGPPLPAGVAGGPAGRPRLEIAIAERQAEARRRRRPRERRRSTSSDLEPRMTIAYIFAGYGLTAAVLAGYAAWVITPPADAWRRVLRRRRPRARSARSSTPAPAGWPRVVVLGALGFLVFQGLGNATLYFRTADEAVAQRAELGDRRFRIEGDVVAGSVRQDGDDVYVHHRRRRASTVPVVHHGRPARAVPARHPRRARGPVPGRARSPATASW